MKKIYEAPVSEIIRLLEEDILTLSDGSGKDPVNKSFTDFLDQI